MQEKTTSNSSSTIASITESCIQRGISSSYLYRLPYMLVTFLFSSQSRLSHEQIVVERLFYPSHSKKERDQSVIHRQLATCTQAGKEGVMILTQLCVVHDTYTICAYIHHPRKSNHVLEFSRALTRHRQSKQKRQVSMLSSRIYQTESCNVAKP